MPPAHRKHHNHAKPLHHHSKALTVNAIQHQGAYDMTSTYEIPTTQSTPHSDSTRDLLSLLPPTRTTSQLPTTSQSTAWIRSPSSFPRASSPIFLYPQSMVTRQKYDYSMQHTATHEPKGLQSLGQSAEQTDVELLFWLGLLGFVVVALAGCWSLVVAAIHHRGLTTGMQRTAQKTQPVQQAGRRQEDEKDQQKDMQEMSRDGWRTWMHTLNPLTAARNGKYDALLTEDFELADRTDGLSSAHDASARLPGLSPENPFLVPQHVRPRAIRPRGSAEWAEQHRAFFATTSRHVSESTLTSTVDSKTHSLSGAELACVESEAREAQDGRAPVAELEDEVLAREQRSWVDIGLATVDGAVDRLAAKIVRWTDDAGRDAELVLPLAKGKME